MPLDLALFLYAYVRKEAVLSSQTEGTQSSLADLLLFELGRDGRAYRRRTWWRCLTTWRRWIMDLSDCAEISPFRTG